MRKKCKEDEQSWEELNLAHRRSQAKCRLVQTSCIKRIKIQSTRSSSNKWTKT